MRQHAPKPAHCRSRDADAKLWEVSLQEGADKVFPPGLAVSFGIGQERAWKSTAQPERSPDCAAGFREIE